MSITEFYKDANVMRQRYFELNGYTHAEICFAREAMDHSNADNFKVMLTRGNGIGCWEPREFTSVKRAEKWCQTYAPELEVVDCSS